MDDKMQCARCGCTPTEHHKLHCEGRDGNCHCYGGWLEPGSALTAIDKCGQAENAEYDAGVAGDGFDRTAAHSEHHAEKADEAPSVDLRYAIAAVREPQDFEGPDAPHRPDLLNFAWMARRLASLAEFHASPAAPADDEAMIERMARASWYASDGFITGLPWPVTGFRAEKERRRVRGALAAYLGQPWYVGQEVEWNPTGDEWKTGFITRLSGDNAGITLHDNAQPLTVSTRNLRSALAALREGQQ